MKKVSHYRRSGRDAAMSTHYMELLFDRFVEPPALEDPDQQALDHIHQRPRHRLEREDRKDVLRMQDLNDLLREKNALYSFFAGFHLAASIVQELHQLPAYNYEAEEEASAGYQEESNHHEA